MDYTDLQKRFTEKGCTLLTTSEEISALIGTKKSVSHLKLKFISKCGHESEGYLTNLLSKGTGVNCRKCVNKIIGQKLRDNIQNGNPSGFHLEFQGYTYLKEIIEKSFEVKKTNEGCLADFVLRPLGSKTDEWLMIQLKTTSKPTFGLYSFSMNGNNYEKCVIAVLCLEDKQCWIVDGEVTKGLKGSLNIATGNSKYNEYFVENNMDIILSDFYEKKILYPIDECLRPTSLQQQQEQQYRSIITNELPYLNCVCPEIEGLKFDLLINGKKVQEKVTSITVKKNGLQCHLAAFYTNNGKLNGKRQYKAYMKGDNDLYWVWVKGQRYFYIIPENELILRNMIDENNVSPSRRVYLGIKFKDTTQWYDKYKFDLDSLNKKKLLQMFT